MNTVQSNQEKINQIYNANRYSNAIIATNGRKTCTELARSTGTSHDAIQRDLDAIAKHPEAVKSYLIEDAINKNRKTPGFLIIDTTTVIKEHSRKIEGVSKQYAGMDETKQGICITAIAWTDLHTLEPVTLTTWKKGDPSKIKTATHLAISLAQKLGVRGTLADAVFATTDAVQSYDDAGVFYTMRFHANRIVSVAGYEGECAVKNHPAFKLVRNNRFVIKEAFWRGKKIRIMAFKIRHKRKGWIILYLVTNMPHHMAKDAAFFYKNRWKIEPFFRACKQKFGLGDCQARSLKKQEAHYLSVFLAYKKYYQNRQKEDLVYSKHHPDRKKQMPLTSKGRLDLNFGAYA